MVNSELETMLRFPQNSVPPRLSCNWTFVSLFPGPNLHEVTVRAAQVDVVDGVLVWDDVFFRATFHDFQQQILISVLCSIGRWTAMKSDEASLNGLLKVWLHNPSLQIGSQNLSAQVIRKVRLILYRLSHHSCPHETPPRRHIAHFFVASI